MRIGLVLSGGGARSFAQVGALQALEDYGVGIEAIAANSSAAILGALYAAGHSGRELEAILREVDYAGFVHPNGDGGLIGHQGVEALLAAHAPATFEELRLPLAVPATDIQNARELVFTSGPLVPAVCASNAFPGLFVPVEFEGRYLMDGGILNNVPLDIIGTLTTAPALVVDVRMSETAQLDLGQASGFWQKLVAPVTGGIPLTIGILMKAYTITQNRLIDLLYARYAPEYVVRPDLGDDFRLQDFGRLDDGIRIGYEATARLLEERLGRPEPAPA